MINMIYEKHNKDSVLVDQVSSKVEAVEWLQDRSLLANAIGFTTKLTDRLLYVLDDSEVVGVYYYRN
jgi:hypothetical protein